ncbi:MAG TPA: alginate lyase family protein [Thermoanaerobaculia bacterium]
MQVIQRTSASRRTLRRLFQMPLPELVYRGRQETFKWVERIYPTAVDRPPHGDRERLSAFLHNSEAHFFEGPFDEQLPATLKSGMTQHCEDLLASAEEIFRGRFDLLGYRDLDLGDHPDWHFDPIANRRAPMRHWSRIDPLDFDTVGDSKIIWELNRHQWLLRLAQAYRLTGDKRYAHVVVRHLQDWINANPAGVGINWASSLEIAFRLIAWCWTLILIRDSRELTPDVFARVLASVEEHATRIERYLSYYFSPNTHLTGEALGLVYAGIVFPDLKRAARWQSVGTGILVQELERQVLSDGVYFERSTCYQRYTVDIYLHFLILAARTGIEVPARTREVVRSMVDVLVALRQPDGAMPSIGDEDSGQLLPLGRTRPDDYRAMFATAAVVFREPAYALAAGDVAADTLWLCGTSAAKIFRGIEQSPPSGDPCRAFAAGGFAVMRNGWDQTGHALIFDTGPLGCPVSSGHGHADLLSIQCSAFGQRYLVDAGTGCYTADRDVRDFFRGTAAHSTVMIDRKSQAEPAGPFGWKRRSSAQLLGWSSDDMLAFADAEHDGYHALPDPVSHRRRVMFIKPRYWVVIDDVTGTANHDVEVRFQFAPMGVRIDPTGWVRATRDGRQGLLLRAFASVPIEGQIRKGCRAPMEGWISPSYGEIEPAPAVVYATNTQLPLRVVTLLWPFENADEPPSVSIMQDRAGSPIGFDLPDLRESLAFGDGRPVITRSSV